MDPQIQDVALSNETQRLYLNYALSVITSRALPDVRDGLKPVQRRILYTMHHELHLRPDGKPSKCARIVGDVMGKYHPHGDSAIYDALVRLAQDWVMRATLVHGQGNFGSLDGDAAAAHRYTEAKLTKIAMELLEELSQKTVLYRPTFDNEHSEPIVLPARFPNVLVNGAQGIAVGMATSIPPHNLGEVIDACEMLIENRKTTVAKLLAKLKGPDFPTGGELITPKSEIKKIYETGQGTVKVRGEWTVDSKKPEQIVITSIPYGLEKHTLVEKIAEVIVGKKLPAITDVRDESTDVVRIVIEMKKTANPELVMAYLSKHTPFQTNVQVNLTCLVPSENPEVPSPQRLDLKQILEHFLDFRLDTVKKRLKFDLEELEKRLHILEGFEKVFDALDEIIKIIRRSEGKQDAAEKIMKRFGLDELQTDAILELKLYRLAKLEILIIKEEADKKRAEAKKIRALLKSEAKLWELVKKELLEIRTEYADKRRTKIIGVEEEVEFKAEDFIVDEDAIVIVSERGWVKRQGKVKDLSNTRTKEGDRVLTVQAGSTRATVAFFSNHGICYVTRIADVPQSSGYGDPIQKMFKFGDGETVIGACSFDARIIEMPEEELTLDDGSPSPPYAVAVTKLGYAFRFSLFPHKEPSTRSGRKYARLKEGDEVLTVFPCFDLRYVIAAADDGHGIAVKMEEIALLSGAGRGTMLIKLGKEASLLAAKPVPSARVGSMVVFTESGRRFELFAEALESTRGARGKALVKRSKFATVEYNLPEVPQLGE
jgi:DNA gyrase subunit A